MPRAKTSSPMLFLAVMLLLCAVQMNRDHCQAGQIGPPRQPDLPHELFGLRCASIQIKIELSLSAHAYCTMKDYIIDCF